MSEKDIDRVVTTGQPFAIDMEAIPGAGYMWELTQTPAGLELVSQDVVSISKAIGGNSTQRFQIVAHHPGSYSILFELKRRWEKNPLKTSRISIRAI